MLENEEYLILYRELGMMLDELQSCTEELIRKKIFYDIKLMAEAISFEPSYAGRGIK
ncbi:hypothetical protein [Peribacillus deserti]|uniref:hypothetical protein n=1 Tax=Peribacillus deserti TaxID=673318 RepID=UPI0015E107EF|nr:hypothetical protein [Peribacillus deserti]